MSDQRNYVGEAEDALEAGELEQAKELYLKALAEADPDDDMSHVHLDLAGLCVDLEQLDSACAWLDAALPALRAGATPARLTSALNQLGAIRRQQGRLDEARQIHSEARSVAAGHRDFRQQAVALRNLAEVERAAGELRRAIGILEDAAELLELEGDRWGQARTWRLIVSLCVEDGRPRHAYEALQRELNLRDGIGDKPAVAATLLEGAQIARLLGDTAQTVAYLDRVTTLRTAAGDPRGAARAFNLAAHALLDARKPLAAAAKLSAVGLLLGDDANQLARAELLSGLAAVDLRLLDAFAYEKNPLAQNEVEDDEREAVDFEALARRAWEQASEAVRRVQGDVSARHMVALHLTLARATAHYRGLEHARGSFNDALKALEEVRPGRLDRWSAYSVYLHYGAWLARRALPAEQQAARDCLERAAIMAEDAHRGGATGSFAAHARGELCLFDLRAGDREQAAAELRRAQVHQDSPTLPRSLKRALRELARRLNEASKGNDSEEVLRQADAAARGGSTPRDLERALYDMRRLQQITKALGSELDADRILDLIVDAAIELTGAERGFLILTGERKGEVACRVARNIERVEVERPGRMVSNSVAGVALETGLPVVSDDATADERFSKVSSVSTLRLRSVLSVPLRVKGEIAGALYVDHRFKTHLFDAHAVELLEGLADHAAVALANARLLAEKSERSQQLTAEREQLSDEVERQSRALEAMGDRLAEHGREASRFHRSVMAGESPAMQSVFALIERVADTKIPVFIQGESGTGKELVARSIHYASSRASGPYVCENFAAISDDLLESELFGHVEGAFTGAVSDKEGIFRRAHGGTVFLDEVGDLSPRMQAELLRVLEEREVRPLGSTEAIAVDVRIIAATHRDLRKMVAEGTFRLDLFHRLNVFPVELPALRERKEDIPTLAEHFLTEFRTQYSHGPAGFTAEALRKLQSFRWPGNVRQLKNLVERTALLCEGDAIEASEVSFGSKAETGDAMADLSLAHWSEAKEAFARRYLRAVLERVEGNVSQGARETGMKRQAFQRLLARHGVKPAAYRPQRQLQAASA